MTLAVGAGIRYGSLVVINIGDYYPGGAQHPRTHVRCDCGYAFTTSLYHLQSGRSTRCRSCACRQHGATAHGRKLPEYSAWRNIRRGHAPFPKSWGDFVTFLRDVGPRPNIDAFIRAQRLDPSEPWSKDNFYWRICRSLGGTAPWVSAELAAWRGQA